MKVPPLPIAALLLRARNAKSAKERHDLAYFGWEASVRLAVAARPPEDRARLAMPSTGDWTAVFVAGAGDRILDEPALLAVQQLLGEEAHGRAGAPRSTTAAKLLEPLAGYRNAVLGHGAVRAPTFYEHAGEVLAAGLDAAWRADVFWPDDARLVLVDAVEVDAAGARRGRVLDLTGAAAVVIDPRGTVVDDDVLPHRLYQARGGGYRSLHPWLLYEAAELRERVLFFNGRGRAARFLDYVGGEQLKAKALAAVCPTVEADLDAAMLPGRAAADDDEPADATRFGDYRILGKLGEGGMGVVYLARQETLDRTVALKMLPPGASDDPVAVARFRREVAALARCEHPNVVKVLAVGVHDGRPYYTMEVVDGADLAHVARGLAGGATLDQAVSTASA
ncbi:MAG: protein kinase, partial [Myxococcales bacterium]|nr:protein kinase [Myxococcales bacterium]